MNKKPTEEKDETEDKDEVKFWHSIYSFTLFRPDTCFEDVCT